MSSYPPVTPAPEIVGTSAGREVAYTTYGDIKGIPVLLLHGTPGTRHIAGILHEKAQSAGIRLLAPDRPGYGNSPAWSDWEPSKIASAIVPVLEDCGVDTVEVMAFSGGAPFGLALAAAKPNRINRVNLVSGAMPPPIGSDPPLSLVALGRIGALSNRVAGALCHGQRYIVTHSSPTRVARSLTSDDRTPPPRVCEIVKRDLQAGLAGGGPGVIAESQLFTNKWTPPTPDVPIRLFHGENDTNAPIEGARRLTDRLPNTELTILEKTDHLGALGEAGNRVFTEATQETSFRQR